jgi:hypothetical protein
MLAHVFMRMLKDNLWVVREGGAQKCKFAILPVSTMQWALSLSDGLCMHFPLPSPLTLAPPPNPTSLTRSKA